jgi:AP endonuclease-2
MFDILEADIVVMQETKIQRKDLVDDMVLVPGWDVYFSLPKHKKGSFTTGVYRTSATNIWTRSIGYSGVAIYTRNATCAAIRAEEGITGILTPPNSSTSFRDFPEDQRIGGYPTASQLADCSLDAATLDSEGRCVVLEFPAFVLIGVYCPANRDESRDEFRIGFLNALDARVRNLVASGKRVFLTGDLNIISGANDTARAEEMIKKQSITMDEFLSTPPRRLFNQLLIGGVVFGERDDGRERPVMWDLCRLYHPDRTGMFTCWDQKINARPGNYGSRIDYVLCSEDWKDWFCESDIQEGLMGSDHCPVYAVLKEKVEIDGKEVSIKDIMSSGMFKDGIRQREWSTKDLLPISAKLIPEFDRRRNIRDMFSSKSSLSSPSVKGELKPVVETNKEEQLRVGNSSEKKMPEVSPNTRVSPTLSESPSSFSTTTAAPMKRSNEGTASAVQVAKRNKPGSNSKSAAFAGKTQPGKGQSSLMGFFKPKSTPSNSYIDSQSSTVLDAESDSTGITASEPRTPLRAGTPLALGNEASPKNNMESKSWSPADQKDVIDPIVSKESWSKLLGKRVVPRCEHNEPCISLVTKKPGVNCGRSFYICPRPVGPSGQKEKNTQWRCGTFIWSSDWSGDGG